MKILEAKALKKNFIVREKIINAVDGVDVYIDPGETLGIVGETGSGKTTLAKLLVGLYKPTSGEIIYYEKNTRKNIQMVFQDPYNSLNPRMKTKDALIEGLIIHKIVKRSEYNKRLCELLNMVEMSKTSLNKYPYEFSGGERQRIAIARALSAEPKLIICDEPVSSLDVSIQGKILHLLLNLQKNLGLSYIFISHDILIIKAISDRIAVMYQGKIAEEGQTQQICETPTNEYTKQLMNAAAYAKL